MNTHEPSQAVRAWLERLPAQHAPTIAALRALIAETAPDAREIVYHDALNYGPTGLASGSILYISAFSAHINLGFFYGAGVPDPQGLLVGTGKRMRHITIRSPRDCANPALAPLLEQAWIVGLSQIAQHHRT